jgi:PadR family transcriptional regulator, regulatory protein PadR
MENQSSMTKYFILSALREQDRHGYELITRLEAAMGKKPSASQIYPVMKKMQSAGYVTAKTKTTGKKKIKVYSITSSGDKLFTGLNKRFEIIISAALKDRIKICAHCDCEMIKGAVQKKINGKSLYFCCESCAASFRH